MTRRITSLFCLQKAKIQENVLVSQVSILTVYAENGIGAYTQPSSKVQVAGYVGAHEHKRAYHHVFN